MLQCLLENSLFVKCKFLTTSIFFLWYIIGQDCMEMDPSKVSAVTSWPIPDSRKQLQRFLGFANLWPLSPPPWYPSVGPRQPKRRFSTLRPDSRQLPSSWFPTLTGSL